MAIKSLKDKIDDLWEKYTNSQLENNSTVDNRIRRKKLKCSLCPPNKNENKKNYKKHGVKKAKYKKERKGR